MAKKVGEWVKNIICGSCMSEANYVMRKEKQIKLPGFVCLKSKTDVENGFEKDASAGPDLGPLSVSRQELW